VDGAKQLYPLKRKRHIDLSKVVNFILFRLEWPKRSISIQKTEQISSHFKSRSVSDFLAKFHPERSCFIPHIPSRS